MTASAVVPGDLTGLPPRLPWESTLSHSGGMTPHAERLATIEAKAAALFPEGLPLQLMAALDHAHVAVRHLERVRTADHPGDALRCAHDTCSALGELLSALDDGWSG